MEPPEPPPPPYQLYEVSVMIQRTAVILATSEADALAHVDHWEDAWNYHSDRGDISDHQVVAHRPLAVSDPQDWKTEAHDITDAAKALLPPACPACGDTLPEGLECCECDQCGADCCPACSVNGAGGSVLCNHCDGMEEEP